MKLTMVAVVGLCAALAGCGGNYVLSPSEAGVAELGARKYAERAGHKYIACSGQDSKPTDGYVTCTLQTPRGEERKIQCPYQGTGECK